MPGQADALEDRNQIVSQAQCYSKPENTHLLCKGKYHWMADLLNYDFGQIQTSETECQLHSDTSPYEVSVLFLNLCCHNWQYNKSSRDFNV